MNFGLRTIAKLSLYGIFLNYYCYYTIKGTFIPHGTILFFGLACLCVGVDALNTGIPAIGMEIKCFILYGVVAAALFFMAQNPSSVISDVLKYEQRIIIVILVAYICEREKSIRFALRLIAITALACGVACMMMANDISQKLTVSSGADLSVNDIGAYMAFGIFAIMYAFGKRGRNNLLTNTLKALGITAMVAVIFVAGSRKSIFAVAIMGVLLLLMCVGEYGNRWSLSQWLGIILVMVVVYYLLIRRLLPYAGDTNLFTRLFGRQAENAAASNESRLELYKLALQEFWNHPIVGLGFNNFNFVHRNYTHSTYVESLANNGVFGFIYLAPYISMFRKQLRLIELNKRKSVGRLKQKEIFVYLIGFLFIGIGIPFMYKDIPCVLLGMFIASQNISFQELRKKGACSGEY